MTQATIQELAVYTEVLAQLILALDLCKLMGGLYTVHGPVNQDALAENRRVTLAHSHPFQVNDQP